MIRAHSPFNGRRIIGDTSKNIVHDLLSEQTGKVTTKSCGIDEIKTKYIVKFDPDEVDTAIKKGFKPCPICLWTHYSTPSVLK